MPYLIDGHNLIGAMPGGHLEDPDDEAALIARLRDFCAASAKRVTVYFDRRAYGKADPPQLGRLSIRFVAEPSNADRAIQAHLKRLRGDARNWTVVSSDAEVAAAARRAGARSMASAAFLQILEGSRPGRTSDVKQVSPLTEQENEELLRQFEAARRQRRSNRAQ